MNLSGALRDDLAALQSGVFFLLEPDASGRYILFVNVARHSLDEYTSDSLVSRYALVDLHFDHCLMPYIFTCLCVVACCLVPGRSRCSRQEEYRNRPNPLVQRCYDLGLRPSRI